MTRQGLHELVNRVPEEELDEAGELLESLVQGQRQKDWDNEDFVSLVAEKIRQGREAIARGEFTTQEDAKKRFAKWLEPSTGPTQP